MTIEKLLDELKFQSRWAKHHNIVFQLNPEEVEEVIKVVSEYQRIQSHVQQLSESWRQDTLGAGNHGLIHRFLQKFGGAE